MAGKILRAHIESFGGVTNKDIDMSEYSVLALIADGGKGKSSIINFFTAALTGVVPDEAINAVTGKAKGFLEFIGNDGMNYRVELSTTKKSDTVRIKSANNMSGGKEVLRKVVGNVLIDAG